MLVCPVKGRRWLSQLNQVKVHHLVINYPGLKGSRTCFPKFGTITSARSCLILKGRKRGFGFVAFSTPENAIKAVKEMNGKMIGKKPLYVAVAQSKKERKAILEARPAQVQALGVAHVSSDLHLSSHLASTRGPQQPYFGQGYASLV
ncbi:hypothetical protein IFM89_039298 [Coptis chinensis]|uniref:RRM domain-containing protein n=1 Tax=Coptis chinensis TaxID=261450 RepID=A0A835I4D6_9MAGN|nr:hypothetical protein IFM89_039298 [Coptis chinensis]